MRYLFALIICFWPLHSAAQNWEDRQVFGAPSAAPSLRILSSTDTAFFEPVIASFLAGNPDISIEYLVTGTVDIDSLMRQGTETFDLAISSAMDLQLKLANDGYARTVAGLEVPEWAQWRQSLFAFTTEPAAIVINRAAFAGHEVPKTRQALIQAMRDRPDFFRNRIGTYDVRKSGVGYLFATQDARASETYWRLMEVMGSLGVRLYCCSGDMIDDLADGTIAVAYNVLGSYAEARPDPENALEVILPADFPTTIMRTAFVPKDAPNPETAAAFIRHLVDLQSGKFGEGATALPPLVSTQENARQSSIALEPALLTYLDKLKRQTFLDEWESAAIQ